MIVQSTLSLSQVAAERVPADLCLADLHAQGAARPQSGTFTLSLRETLWYWKLSSVLVFETGQHIERARSIQKGKKEMIFKG